MSISVTLHHPLDEAKKAGSVELPAEIFDVTTNLALIHQVVVAQLAAARQGTHDTKSRGEVSGGGRKPYRQKGTGRARQGSTRAPQFAGGGVVHGPTPRSYDQRTPKKMKAAALRGALSDRARHDLIHVASALVAGDAPSTKSAAAALASITEARRVLVVAERSDQLTWKSVRNLDSVHVLDPGQLNTYDVLVSDEVVFIESALTAFINGPAKGKSAKATASSAEVSDAPSFEKAPAEAVVEAAPVEAATEDAGFGPDSHAPIEGDEQPEGFPIKGNADSMLYHVPGTRFYASTVAEVWFRSAEAAEAAGFLLPPSQRKAAEPTNGEES